MAIIQTVNASDFHDAFHNMGRGDQFTYGARCAIFDYLDEMAEECGEPFELDVIGICCDIVECESINDLIDQYLTDDDKAELFDDRDTDEIIEWITEWLSEQTSVISISPDSIVFFSF